jgi:predicted enzyme related to lactoylglutathione lyase
MPYFEVADCDAAVAKAKELGGRIYAPATDIPKVGRFAVLADHQGAVFAVIKMARA